jgi:hypothetical protein
MSHYPEKLETELASEILRAEQTLWILKSLLFLLLEQGELEGMQLFSSAREGSLTIGGAGKALEDSSKTSLLYNLIFSHWGISTEAALTCVLTYRL